MTKGSFEATGTSGSSAAPLSCLSACPSPGGRGGCSQNPENGTDKDGGSQRTEEGAVGGRGWGNRVGRLGALASLGLAPSRTLETRFSVLGAANKS